MLQCVMAVIFTTLVYHYVTRTVSHELYQLPEYANVHKPLLAVEDRTLTFVYSNARRRRHHNY